MTVLIGLFDIYRLRCVRSLKSGRHFTHDDIVVGGITATFDVFSSNSDKLTNSEVLLAYTPASTSTKVYDMR